MKLKNAMLGNVLLALACVISAEMTAFLSLPSTGATPLWLPAGFVVSAVLIWGYAVLPGAIVASLFYSFSLLPSTSLQTWPWMALLALQPLLLAVTARMLIRSTQLWPITLIREKQILKFFLITAVIAPLLPSLISVWAYWQLGLMTANHVIEGWILDWLGMAMGIILVCPVMMSFFAEPRSLWQPRMVTVAIPMILLFVLTLVALGLVRDRENTLSQSRFESSVTIVHSLIESELGFHVSLLQSLQAYFHNSSVVTRDEFQDFLADYDLHVHDLRAFIWAEWQPKQQQLISKYAMDYSVLPAKETPDLIGNNLCYGEIQPICANPAALAPDAMLTLPLSSDASRRSMLNAFAVRDKQGQFLGLIMQVVEYDSLFEHMEKAQGYAAVNFVVTDLSSGEVIFDNTASNMAFTALGVEASRILSNRDYQWRVDYFPSNQFVSVYVNWNFYWVVAVSLFLLGLIEIWLMTMTGRYRLVEQEVARKTQALHEHTQLLSASEEKYRRLVENIQDEYFIYLHDKDGVFRYVSPSIETILGYSQNEFLKHYDTFLPNTELNWHVGAMTAQTLSGRKSNYELEIWSKAGKMHTLAVSEMPHYNEDGDIGGVEGIARDITEFKASQQKLEKLSLAVENSPNAILIMDKFGKVEYVNPKFTAITGFKNDENIGRWPDIINSGTNNPAIYHEIWRTIRAGQEWSGELQNRKKNGELYWAQELIAPMLTEEGHVTHFVATQIDITEVRRLSEQTSYQASHDQLTGLINRHEFDQRLNRVIQAAKHNLTEHALCFLDLDQFKVINDTCGHVAGDELLRQIGGLLQGNIRSRDTIARLGGDEFAILMEHCTIDQAFKACEQILLLLQDFRFHWQEYTFTVGASIGLAIVDQHTRDTTEALRYVDTACYSAKDAGRNRVEVHREDSARLQERRGELQWSSLIGEALDHDRFLLYAQPIKPLKDPALGMSYEVLVRMERNDGEISPPGAFLPAAERYNSIVRIDRWVVSRTLSWLAKHVAQLQHVTFISINLSGLTLSDETILNFIIEQLESGAVPASKIKFEITETAAIANLRAATRFIDQLSTFGVRFALDDFGSGLSSFAYLKKLKVDALKIDGMFVKDMLSDPLDYEMVKSINDIGHVMGLQTIAEFVEQDELIEKLHEIGVDYIQGYAVGRPVPLDELLIAPSD